MYSLLILLPEAVEDELRRWGKRAPGASLPFWGGHITLLGDFVPTRGLGPIERRAAEVCARSRPFIVDLDRVVAATHWRRPHQKAVMLRSNPRTAGHPKLLRLRRELATALAPIKRDAHPDITQRRFHPHLSLTWGLPAEEADALAAAAQAAHLRVEFTVERIWLLRLTPNSTQPRQVERVRAIELG